MFKLGIIGSDNSHAIAFSRLANIEEGHNGLRVEDARVTHIYGTDPERTAEVAEKGQIPHIVDAPEAMLGQVDGVACVWRHGSKHLEYALPFIEAGVPTFVDKPLAGNIADATRLVDAAESAGIGFTSFSTLRVSQATLELIAELKKSAGPLACGVVSSPADPESQYDGIFFYGIHAADMMNAVWDCGCRSVCATSHEQKVVAICKFDGGAVVTLNLPHHDKAKCPFHILAIGKDGWSQREIDSATAYYHGMQIFIEAMKTGKWPLSREQILEPIKVLTALDLSLKEQREVELAGL